MSGKAACYATKTNGKKMKCNEWTGQYESQTHCGAP